MTVSVISGQSLLDIAIQELGSALAVFELAFVNGLSVTDNLIPGQKIIVPASTLKDIEVTNYFKGRQQTISTAITADQGELITPRRGIGSMIIGKTFIVG